MVYLSKCFDSLLQSDETASSNNNAAVNEHVADVNTAGCHENGNNEVQLETVVMRRRVRKRRNSKRLSIINGHLYDAEVKTQYH